MFYKLEFSYRLLCPHFKYIFFAVEGIITVLRDLRDMYTHIQCKFKFNFFSKKISYIYTFI